MTCMTWRLWKDRLSAKVLWVMTVGSALMVLIIAGGLYAKSYPILKTNPLRAFLLSGDWHPLQGEFGLLPFIMGSLWVTSIAVIIAVPLCVLTSVYLSEYAPRWVRHGVKPMVDLLAGIPSVVFGVWGVLVVVPVIRDVIAPRLGTYSSGYTVLAGGIVLAVMIFPILIHVCLEVLTAVPGELREASLSLGATQWQTIKHVVVRKAMPGLLAAVVLGVSRAFGETIAVLMVAGNVARIPSGLLDPAYPLPALIANNYGEMMSVPLYDSALMLACLVLMLIVVGFNVLARFILVKIERRIQ